MKTLCRNCSLIVLGGGLVVSTACSDGGQADAALISPPNPAGGVAEVPSSPAAVVAMPSVAVVSPGAQVTTPPAAVDANPDQVVPPVAMSNEPPSPVAPEEGQGEPMSPQGVVPPEVVVVPEPVPPEMVMPPEPEVPTPVVDPLPPTASEGCTAINPDHVGERTLEGMISFEGGERPYRVLLPSTYGEETRAWPLVFALHPNGQRMGLNFWDDDPNSTNNEVNPGIIDAADDRAIVLTPASIDGFWNRGGDRDAHVSMLDNLYEFAEANLCIDKDKVYSIGHSGGAGFSAHMACNREYIKAFACNGGISYFGTDDDVRGGDCVHEPKAWFGWGQNEGGGVSLFNAYRSMHGCKEASPNFDDKPVPCVDLECDTGRMRFCRPPGGHGWPDGVTQDVLGFLLED